MKLRSYEEESREWEGKQKEGRLRTFLKFILYAPKAHTIGLYAHSILLMRLGFYGPSGCTSMFSRHDGHREVPYVFSSLSRGKDAKILTLVFLSDEVKSDSCFIFKKPFLNLLSFHNLNKC